MKTFLYHNDWYDLILGLFIGVLIATIFWVTLEFSVVRIENKAQRQLDFANGEQHILNQKTACRWLETLNTKTGEVTKHGNCIIHRSSPGMECQQHEHEFNTDGKGWIKYKNENKIMKGRVKR